MSTVLEKKYKKIFDDYFKRQVEEWEKISGHKPLMAYDEKIDKEFYISKANDDDEAEWQPLPIESVDWGKIESKLGFKLQDELKAFYGAYRFLECSGKIENEEYVIKNFGVNNELETDIVNRLVTSIDSKMQLFYIGSINSETQLLYSNYNGKMYINDEDMDIDLQEFKYNMSEIIEKMSGM